MPPKRQVDLQPHRTGYLRVKTSSHNQVESIKGAGRPLAGASVWMLHVMVHECLKDLQPKQCLLQPARLY